MAIFLSKHLKTSLAGAQISCAQLVQTFAWWKADPARKDESAFFGRDTQYAVPQLDGRGMILWHVHMLPIKDESAHRRWLRIFQMRGEKTSDKVLVYARNDVGDFLLIYLFDEPGGHAAAWNEERKMRAFYRLAVSFMDGDLTDCEEAA